MDLLADLDARGLIHETTDRQALAERLAQGPTTLYYGMDPTADSLHTGNLIGLLMVHRFLAAGHRVLALAGGATGMIGDPSGRSTERNLLDAADLDRNVAAIEAQIARVLGHAGGSGSWKVVNNRDWTGPITLLEFLRDVGKHVTVNQMLARESVKNRLASEHGISYTEFSYMLLQANDFLWLHRNEDVELQIGGSDQWGNIVSGIDLIRRHTRTVAHGLCWPLLTAPDGLKLGKSTGARIWLDPERTSPYQFFQHWMQTDDRQVHQFLAWFTLLPVDEIDALVAQHGAAPHRRVAQRALAREATALVHGQDAASAAAGAAEVLFGGALDEAGAGTFEMIAAEVPTLVVDRSRIDAASVVDLACEVGLVASKGEARRLVKQNGLSLNGDKVDQEERVMAEADLRHGRFALLRRGKDRYALVDVRG